MQVAPLGEIFRHDHQSFFFERNDYQISYKQPNELADAHPLSRLHSPFLVRLLH